MSSYFKQSYRYRVKISFSGVDYWANRGKMPVPLQLRWHPYGKEIPDDFSSAEADLIVNHYSDQSPCKVEIPVQEEVD